MKKTLIATAIAASTLVSANTVMAAEKGTYFGASYDLMSIDFDGDSFDSSVLSLRLGQNFNENIGFEVVYGTGVTDETQTFDGIDLTVGVKNYYGAYLTGMYPVTDQFDITSKVGFTNVTLEAEATDGFDTVSLEDDDSSVSWGIGASYAVTDKVRVTADYTMLYSDSDGDIAGLTLGARYAF